MNIELDIESKRLLWKTQHEFEYAYKVAVELLVGSLYRQILGNVNRIANCSGFSHRSYRTGCFGATDEASSVCDGRWIAQELKNLPDTINEMYIRVGESNLMDTYADGVKKYGLSCHATDLYDFLESKIRPQLPVILRKWIKYRWVTIDTGDYSGQGAEFQGEEASELREISNRFEACESCIQYVLDESKCLKMQCFSEA